MTIHPATTAPTALRFERDDRPMVDRFRSWSPDTTTATLAIAGCGVASASAALFARRLTEAGIAPVTVAWARYALIVALLARFARFDRAARSATVWGLVSGAGMAFGWIAYVGAVASGSVAGAGVVYMTYPMFTLAALIVLFRVRPSGRQVLGGALVAVAAAAALGLGGDIPWYAVAAPASFGLSIAVLTERLGELDPFERIAAVGIGAFVVLAPLVLSRPTDEILPADLTGWSWLIGLSLGSALIPMTVYACAAPRIGAPRAAVTGAIELPTMLLIGIGLGETVGLTELIAGVLICTAVVITPATRPAHVVPGEAHRTMASTRPAVTSTPT